MLSLNRRLKIAPLFLALLLGCDEADLEAFNDAELETQESPQFRVLDTSMPGVTYCDGVRDWSPERVAFENAVLEETNRIRAQGAECGSRGSFAPAPALRLNSALRCPARAHSLDMLERGYFNHSDPDGKGVVERVARVQYSWTVLGENIAAGQPNPQAVVAGWKASDGHCANMMNPSFNQLGVGYAPGGPYNHYWTQVFARGEDRAPNDQDEQNPSPAPVLGGIPVLVLAPLFAWVYWRRF